MIHLARRASSRDTGVSALKPLVFHERVTFLWELELARTRGRGDVFTIVRRCKAFRVGFAGYGECAWAEISGGGEFLSRY
jgi:hypothetical protein